MNEKIDKAVTEIWQYMQVGDEVGSADCLIVLGSRDERVAVHAAELAVRHSYAHVVITGGSAHSNDLLATTWNAANEAEYFGSVMRSCGYTQPLLLETEALNTGQNATNTYALLKKQGITIKTAVLVTKPYMERRAKATFEVQWPDNAARFYVTSQQLSFADYILWWVICSVFVSIQSWDFLASRKCLGAFRMLLMCSWRLAIPSICCRKCLKYYVDKKST